MRREIPWLCHAGQSSLERSGYEGVGR
jgi:hypothetical protein